MLKSQELFDPRSCFNKARNDEMLFVCLERDAAVPGTIRDWIQRRISLGLNRSGDAQLVEAEQCANYIEEQLRQAGKL